jgi:chlorite dismutase
MLHPVAYAGWAGLFVTALNLLPIGQLDGGHVANGLLGKRSVYVFWGFLGALAVLAFFYPQWWVLVALLLLILTRRRRVVADESIPLDSARVALGLFAFLEPTGSYVSMVELAMYEMTMQIHKRLAERGLKLGSDEFDRAFDGELEEQRKRVGARLFIDPPRRRHVCFYPMSKKRGEHKNWYVESMEDRARMMLAHGKIGRHYAGEVTQIITGSIGFDDWEWGVDLFADDPLVFKKLIYEMRYDEASAWYAEFGPFYIGLQFSPAELPKYLDGHVPALVP